MSSVAPRLSVIIPARNIGGVRLDNCLRSLRWQDVAPESVEILLSDFGSDDTYQAELLALAEAHQARVIRTETDEIWNRSRALNVAIRAARGRYVLCTDADMIFATNFLGTLLEIQEEEGDRALGLCRCRDLPEDLPSQRWTEADVKMLVDRSAYRERLGTGACQMATRDFFMAIRGFDERYKGWGCEDKDMTFRAQRYGLKHRWIHETTAMMHQWHPSVRTKWPVQKTLNDIRFHITKWRVRKNTFSWGGGR